MAVSLHAAKQKTRDVLLPKCTSTSLEDLQEALVKYNVTSGRRFTIEYMLIRDCNDSDSDMDALADFCEGLNCHINLIPLNEVEHSPLKPSPKSTVARWEHGLQSVGLPVTVRDSRGSDICGACGQLAKK